MNKNGQERRELPQIVNDCKTLLSIDKVEVISKLQNLSSPLPPWKPTGNPRAFEQKLSSLSIPINMFGLFYGDVPWSTVNFHTQMTKKKSSTTSFMLANVVFLKKIWWSNLTLVKAFEHNFSPEEGKFEQTIFKSSNAWGLPGVKLKLQTYWCIRLWAQFVRGITEQTLQIQIAKLPQLWIVYRWSKVLLQDWKSK